MWKWGASKWTLIKKMKNKNKSRIFNLAAGLVIVFVIVVLSISGRIVAKNLSADFDLDIGSGGGIDLDIGNTSISIGGGGDDTQPGCGSSNCLTVPDADNLPGIAFEGSLREMILKWVNFFLGFLGLIAMIALIYAGFLYVTSLGNDEQAKKAKNIIIWVVLGIIIILLAFALVNTLITTGPTGSDLIET